MESLRKREGEEGKGKQTRKEEVDKTRLGRTHLQSQLGDRERNLRLVVDT